MSMTVNDRMRCEALLLRACALMTAVMWKHLYSARDGERPDAECSLYKWITDCQAFLTEESNEGTGSV